jgi:hypothetical protein
MLTVIKANHLCTSAIGTLSDAGRSISGNDYDCDDKECRDQRKSAVKSFRSGLCDIIERRHDLGWWPQFANEPANVSGFHWI